ncbi:Uncharacterised protein [Mycobacteroides abscessus]|nr:Uncharacterised protein [Mycobacteroides abscessus]
MPSRTGYASGRPGSVECSSGSPEGLVPSTRRAPVTGHRSASRTQGSICRLMLAPRRRPCAPCSRESTGTGVTGRLRPPPWTDGGRTSRVEGRQH